MTFHSSRSIYVIIAFVTIFFGSCAQPFDFDFEDSPEDAPEEAPTDPSDPSDRSDPSDPADPEAVALGVAGESFTLAWDPAGGDVTGYEVYYRPHGSDSWTELGTTGTTDTQFEVSSAILDYGTYEFAVAATIDGGGTTEYHTSLDATADPDSGWYLEWTAI
jgi:hypothetical protein